MMNEDDEEETDNSEIFRYRVVENGPYFYVLQCLLTGKFEVATDIKVLHEQIKN